MNKTTIITIIASILTLIVIVWVGIISVNATTDQVLWQCFKNDFKNITIHGDLNGNIDCNEFYLNNYGNGKWTKKCSTLFSTKYMNCHDLCNIDCHYYNLKNQGSCVC